MAFTLPGADVSLARNQATGKFDIQWGTDGNPVFADDQSHAVLSLIYEHRGEWWADTSGARGSYLFSVKEDRKSTPSKIKGYIEDGLQPLIDQGNILPPAKGDMVTATRVHTGRVDPTINYSLPGGLTITLRPAIGY